MAALVIEVVYEAIFFFLTAYLVKLINKMPEGISIVVHEKTKEVIEVIG